MKVMAKLRRMYKDSMKDTVANSKRYYESHKEKCGIAARKWDTENKEKRVEITRNWQSRNKDKVIEMRKIYRLNNKDKVNAWNQNRRARLFGAIGIHTGEEWKELKESYNYMCAYCGNKFTELSEDHIIPLSSNGTNYIDNVVPACKLCNSKKSYKPLLLFMFQEVQI